MVKNDIGLGLQQKVAQYSLNMRSCFDDGYGAELHEAHIQCIGSKAC